MDNPEAYLPRLKAIHLFKGLDDDEILEFARQLERVTVPAGEVVFHEGDEGQHFYIVHRGQAQVLRQHGKEQEQISLLSPGDYFGETALMYGRRRSATIAALTDLELLQLSKEDFDNLLRRYPEIKPNLLVSVESRKIYRRLNLSWLNPNEVVYLIARRHVVLLVQALILPALAGGGVLALAFALWWFYFDLWALGILIFGSLAVAGWVWWVVTDWSNDYYIVTNQRVVYLEKIIGIYDSRQEAPLQFVLSVNTQTAGTIERALGIGDVIVRTFSGPIVMQAVANPQALAALVEEHWNRTKTREREAERDAMKQTVRRRVGLAPPEPPKPPAPPSPPKPPSVGQQLARFFSFKVRFELGESVVYRKHWYMLLRQIWEPSALILADLGLIGLKLGGILPAEWPLTMVMFIALVLFIPLAGWWLYQFVDWKNDIYQVTPEQILDIDKKPLGPESRKSAPLGNILSLKYERPGLLGLLLNFGDVVALVGGQEFRFEGVFDPVSVQNDVYRRMEAHNAKKAQAEAAKRREEISEWLGVYHTVLNETEQAKKQKPG